MKLNITSPKSTKSKRKNKKFESKRKILKMHLKQNVIIKIANTYKKRSREIIKIINYFWILKFVKRVEVRKTAL